MADLSHGRIKINQITSVTIYNNSVIFRDQDNTTFIISDSALESICAEYKLVKTRKQHEELKNEYGIV